MQTSESFPSQKYSASLNYKAGFSKKYLSVFFVLLLESDSNII